MNKRDVKTKEDLWEYYKKVRKIKFQNDVKIANFDDMFTSLVDKKLETIYVRGGKQCEQHKYRSLDDVIKIYRYYYPDKNLKDLKQDILNSKNDIKDYTTDYCPNIRKNNFRGFVYYGYDILNTKFNTQGFETCNVTLNDY